jgi:hypothetical protein
MQTSGSSRSSEVYTSSEEELAICESIQSETARHYRGKTPMRTILLVGTIYVVSIVGLGLVLLGMEKAWDLYDEHKFARAKASDTPPGVSQGQVPA